MYSYCNRFFLNNIEPQLEISCDIPSGLATIKKYKRRKIIRKRVEEAVMFGFGNQLKRRILTIIRLVCTLLITVFLPRIFIHTAKKYKLNLRYKNSYIIDFHINSTKNNFITDQAFLLAKAVKLKKDKSII